MPLALIGIGLGVSVLAALHLGGPAGAFAMLVGEGLHLLLSIPLSLLLMLAVAWLTNIYFGTLRQLTAFSLASPALGIVLLFGLAAASPFALVFLPILSFAGFCWLSAKLFDLRGSELVIACLCTAGFQGIALIVLQVLPVAIRPAFETRAETMPA